MRPPCAQPTSAAVFASSVVSICAGPMPGDRSRMSAAAPTTCGAAADVPAKPVVPHPPHGPYVAPDTLSGAKSSGLVRPSIVGPIELYWAGPVYTQHIAPAAMAAGDDAGSIRLCCVPNDG